MDFKSDARIRGGSARSGGGGRGGLAIGGGAGLVVLVIALFLGVDPSMLLSGGPQPETSSQPGSDYSHCQTGADVESEPECRWPAYSTSTNDFWIERLNGYEESSIITFSGQVSTGCGTASSQTGPFYCPADRLVYIDTDFLGKLLNELGTQGGQAAEVYIVAHEFGHHAQELQGLLAKSRQGAQQGEDSPAVRAELQADCYAGVYLAWANENPDDLIENITAEDMHRVMDAARVVGDDHIQERSGEINPDLWTHGSSEMRQRWLDRGLSTGDVRQCDTFSARTL